MDYFLQFSWPAFEIDIDDLKNFLSTTYTTNYNGIVAEEDDFTVVFNTSVPDNAQTDIQAHLDSLTSDGEALKIALEEKTDAINNYRDNVLNAGYTWNSHIYDSDLNSRLNLTAAVAGLGIGMTLPDTFTWRTQDNQNIPMTQTDLSTFALSMLAWAETIYGVSWYHKTNVQALTTAADVIAYDITAGWPAN